jgi:hypothetical protein
MSIIELLPEPNFNRISSSFEKNEPGNGKFAELLDDQVETNRGENERPEQLVEKHRKVDDGAPDENKTSTAIDDHSDDDHSDIEREARREDYKEDEYHRNSTRHRQLDESHNRSEENSSDRSDGLANASSDENTVVAPSVEVAKNEVAQQLRAVEQIDATTITSVPQNHAVVEPKSTANPNNRTHAIASIAASVNPQMGLARAAQVQKQDIPVGLEKALNILGQTSQIISNTGIDIPASPTAGVENQVSSVAKSSVQKTPQKSAIVLPQQQAAVANVNLDADNLPVLRNHTAIAQLLQQDKPVEINSLIQYFQAKMGQNPGTNSVDAGSTNTANQTTSNLVQTLKSMMAQSSFGGQMGSQGQNNQNGLPPGAVMSGLASSQTSSTGNTQASFANSIGIDSVGIGGQPNSLQVQQAVQVANLPAPSQAATNMQSPTIQIGFQIAKAVDQGINRMSIRLDPAELGRVQIQLEVGSDGRVQAMIMADKQDTLDLLQKDARMLEKVLKDAGLETSAEDLSFSLQQGNQNQWASSRPEHLGQSSSEMESGDDVSLTSNDHNRPDIISDRALDVRV